MTLLQNENNILPFAPGKKISVIGPLTSGSSKGRLIKVPDVHTEIKDLNSQYKGTTTYNIGCDVDGTSTSKIKDAVNSIKDAD